MRDQYPLNFNTLDYEQSLLPLRESLVSRKKRTSELYEQAKCDAQGGKRLGDETSVSEQKGVMQWTGIELGARPKFKLQRSKFEILIIY